MESEQWDRFAAKDVLLIFRPPISLTMNTAEFKKNGLETYSKRRLKSILGRSQSTTLMIFGPLALQSTIDTYLAYICKSKNMTPVVTRDSRKKRRGGVSTRPYPVLVSKFTWAEERAIWDRPAAGRREHRSSASGNIATTGEAAPMSGDRTTPWTSRNKGRR